MAKVIGVRFQNAGKLYYFDPQELWPEPGDYVVVETSRGMELGEVVTSVQEVEEDQLTSPLKPVIRIAGAEDVQHQQDNRKAEKEAYSICQRKIGEHKLDMKLVSVEYTFDNSKILFYFTANGRVDFRSLVKDLAGVFKTRIELRQIGVRDEAKMLGGLGPCGRPICCGAFLGDFQPVSIKMAKEQNLSLNPTKISGVCGRLMCCLKYEQDNYEQTRKRMPKVGKEVMTPDGVGVVWDLNIIKETVRVRIQKGDTGEVKDYPLEEVQRVGVAPRPVEVPAEPVVAEELPTTEEEQTAEAPLAAPAPKAPRANGKPPKGKVRIVKQKSDSAPQEKEEEPRKNPQLGKPVQRENPNRKNRRDAEGEANRDKNGPDRKERRQPKGAQPRNERPPKESTPAESPVTKPVAEAPKAAAAAQPAEKAVSPWKKAVEEAMKAAKGEQ